MKIIVCDDQAIVRDGLELLLKLEKDIEVIGLAQDGAEAVELVAKNPPDLVLMDLKMPGMNGVEATRRICAEYPSVKVLVLTKIPLAKKWLKPFAVPWRGNRM